VWQSVVRMYTQLISMLFLLVLLVLLRVISNWYCFLLLLVSLLPRSITVFPCTRVRLIKMLSTWYSPTHTLARLWQLVVSMYTNVSSLLVLLVLLLKFVLLVRLVLLVLLLNSVLLVLIQAKFSAVSTAGTSLLSLHCWYCCYCCYCFESLSGWYCW
jgi:hypothetical protein